MEDTITMKRDKDGYIERGTEKHGMCILIGEVSARIVLRTSRNTVK
jgi:hypothetical protein